LKKNKNILICPLEWGLGHATRMIPVAAELLRNKHNVIFASGEEHLSLMRNELPECTYLSFPGFKPNYSRHLPQYISILLKIPLLAYHIVQEHIRLKNIIRKYSIDIVISDNRFGLWNRNIKTVYITHMPLIPFPSRMRFLEPLGVFIHRWIIRKYDLCFIPDIPGVKNLSGRLSHGVSLPENVRFIGILSRFTSITALSSDIPDFKYNTIILSGPEPQKEILKQKLIRLFIDKEPVTIMLEGKPGKPEESGRIGNIILYNHLPSKKMKSIISGSEGIISRSGYTSIMDLLSLNCRALLIPTPGQTEQEYLAEYMSEQGYFSSIRQNDLKQGLEFPDKKSSNSDEMVNESRRLLRLALDEMSEEPHQQTKTKIPQKKT
jgi:UDP:flavonoid glycosyltransferase YjiC (YdhE family)